MGRRKSFLKKIFGMHIGYLLFSLLAMGVRCLPVESLEFYGEKLGVLAFYLFKKRKKVASNNLHLALGKEKRKEEIERICRDSFKNIGKNMMETWRCLDFDDAFFKRLVKLEGKEYLDRALREGNGVIALTAHFGNFPLMAARLVNEGYSLSIVARDPENPRVAQMITSLRDTVGMESIPDKPRMTCVSRCLRALEGNRILFTQIDQNAPITECWVDFFGYLVPTFKGPVVLSLRTGAPILPMFAIRNSDSLHRIMIHPPFKLNTTGKTQQDITSNTARLTKFTEAVIREYPEQWWWIHRRFKRARDIRTGKRLFSKRV